MPKPDVKIRMSVLIAWTLILAAGLVPVQSAHAQHFRYPRCEILFEHPRAQADWIEQQKNTSRAVIESSPNLPAIRQKLIDIYGESSRKSWLSTRLGGKERIELWSGGIGKPDEIRLVTDETSEVLFSTHNGGANDGAEKIEDFHLSPDSKTVQGATKLLVLMSRDGSIDSHEIIVIDLKSKIVDKRGFYVQQEKIRWISPTTFLFYGWFSPRQDLFLARYNTEKKKIDYPELRNFSDGQNGLLIAQTRHGKIIFSDNGTRYQLPERWAPSDAIGKIGHSFYLLNRIDPDGSVLKATPGNNGSIKVKEIVSPAGYPLQEADVFDDFLLLRYRWGERHIVKIFDPVTLTASVIPIPHFAKITKIKWDEKTKCLRFTFSSPVVKEANLDYDPQTQTWNDRPYSESLFENLLLQDLGGQRFFSTVAYIPSKDGTNIPVRLVYANGTHPNTSTPAIIDVYGGFGRNGYIDSAYQPMVHEFLKRGGLYIAPAVRGGDEFDDAWYQNGKLKNKINTIDDVIATARWLSNNGWSSASKIVLRGSSNGGFVVAAVALYAPNAFGMIVSRAGVHDWFRKHILDHSDWKHEYGDGTKNEDREWMRLLSPVTLARQRKNVALPKFLITAGEEDSRVRVEHSYALAHALLDRKNPTTVYLHVEPKGGHFADHTSAQNIIGLRTESAEWALIYDHFGMTF